MHDFFYSPPSHIGSEVLTIDGEELQHVLHVIRKKAGDVIVVVDGNGNLFEAEIQRTTRREVECRIISRRKGDREEPTPIVLGVGILKNHAKFDFLVEKATELGVRTIVPLLTTRTIPQHAKEDRWQKLALAAMKQSGRCILPHIAPLTSYGEFLRSAGPASVRLIPHEGSPQSLPALLLAQPPAQTMVMSIGPEGGWTEDEVELARESGFTPVNLGPRILRTETAAIVATACCSLLTARREG